MALGGVRQRTVYLVTAALVGCMVGGFALAASFQTGGVNSSQQGSQTTTVGPIKGLEFVSTNLTELDAAVVQPSCGASAGSSCNVAATPEAFCTGGFPASTQCAQYDYVEEINLTTVVAEPLGGVAALTVFVTGTPVGASTPITVTCPAFYVSESVTPTTAVTLTFFFDVGTVSSGPGAVTSVTISGNVL